MENDDEAIPPVPPIGYERLVAESKFLGDALEMPPPDSNGEEYRVVMARNSRRLELALWRAQYRTLAMRRDR
jgi:hypothetical protein